MLTLILRLVLEGEALLEIEETSKYLANDTYVTLGTSKEVVEELTLAIKNLILKIPNEKIYEWQEFAEELYRDCLGKGKVGVYIVFMSEFIHHPRFQADLYTDMHVRNISQYISTDDPEILEKVIDCIDSGATLCTNPEVKAEVLFYEWQNSLVKYCRQQIEDKMGIDEDDETFDEQTLPIFENQRGTQVLIKAFLYVLLHGKIENRADAAFLIGIICQFSPIENFKKLAIKMAGGLIRIVNDKFDVELKATIFRALRRMFVRVGKLLKPMFAPLKTTFNQYSKQEANLSDEIKEERNKLKEVIDSLVIKRAKGGK